MPGLSGPKPSMRSRPGGGFNSMMGNSLNAEHLDENARQQSSQNHQLTQQQADPQAAAQQAANQKRQAQDQKPPREVGTLAQEGRRFFGDLKRAAITELKHFFNLNTWLGIDEPEIMTPEEKAKAKQQVSRFNQLTQEQQQYAKQLHQQRMQKKKAEEELEEQKKQQEAQKKAAAPVMPSSPKKGPIGPASGKSKKQNAQAKLQMDRQRMSQGGGSN